MPVVKRYRLLGCLVAMAVGLAAQAIPPGQSAAAQSLAAYLARVRQVASSETTTLGSLWTSNGRYANLSTDYKARNINDLITIDILENTQATGSGTVQSKRAFDASSGISNLLGPIGPNNSLQALFSPSSASDLNGQAQTASSSQLTTSLTGRVVDVLPNGYLVIEAVRTISMDNQSQTVIVHGVVRPADIAPDNSVLSTQVGELEVDLLGKGIISDGTRPPPLWVRLLMRFVNF